jgi:hypothetical protein
MIQRVQSIYLFLVSLVNILAAIFVATILENQADALASFDFEYQIYFAIITVLAIWAVFSFKKRGFQMQLGRLNFILNFVALGFLVYWLLILPGEIEFSKKGIGLVIPVISIVFIVLAQKAIKRDDELVKSADRFR